MSIHSTCGLITTPEQKRPFQGLPEENNQVMGTEIRPVSAAPPGTLGTQVPRRSAGDVRKEVCCCCLATSVMSDSLQPLGLKLPRTFCPWDSLSKNTGVGCHVLLQGIFPTQGSNPHFLHWQVDSLPPEPPGEALFEHIISSVLNVRKQTLIVTSEPRRGLEPQLLP